MMIFPPNDVSFSVWAEDSLPTIPAIVNFINCLFASGKGESSINRVKMVRKLLGSNWDTKELGHAYTYV